MAASQSATAHNLDFTTAQVQLRNDTHLSIRIEVDLAVLTGRIDWDGKPAKLVDLAGASDEELEALRSTIVEQFSDGMPVRVGGLALVSQKVRVARAAELRKDLHALIATQLIRAKDGHAGHRHDGKHDLVIHIDGFVPNAAESRTLEIDFPAALGLITVSYSEPRMQTLRPDGASTRYVEQLD